MFDLTLEMRKRPGDFVDLPEGSKFGSWQLIWKEPMTQDQDSGYNPCKEFDYQQRTTLK